MNKKKVGLCVRYDCNNYGSMLQILATQKAIQDVGWEYELIRYDKKTPLFLIKNLTRVFNPYFMRGVLLARQKKRNLAKYPDIQRRNANRIHMIGEYRKTYLGPYSKIYKGYSKLVQGTEDFDAIMVGSDQLWTPAGIKSKFYNLLFVPDTKKKISFATSFGVSKVPDGQVKATARYLSRIDYLSVREKRGQEMIRELTGRDSLVALDPTLLYDGAQWENIFPLQAADSEPYMFAYFLGDNPEHRERATTFAKTHHLKLITCPHMDQFVSADVNFGDEQRFETGPVEFLNLIRGAEYIFTDSFHGTVFSILNHKRFLTFYRFAVDSKQSRNSRVDNLLDMLGLQSRKYSGDNTDNATAEIDYASADRILAQERLKTFAFLQEALNGQEP